MTIGVFIDSMVWDFLYDRQLDLEVELPPGEFSLCITREAEFEIAAMPAEKKAFVEAAIARCKIPTDMFFGFAEASPPGEHRLGGFGVGRFASAEEIAFIEKQRHRVKERKDHPTKLHKDEADLSVAARSFHSIVLSNDTTGPIRAAGLQGGKIVSLQSFDESGMTLGSFIKLSLASCS